MKTLFIPSKRKVNVHKERILEISKRLPKNIIIAYSIQFQDLALQIKKILCKRHNITKITQVLGCSRLIIPQKTQAILLIGSGRFHATSLALETNMPIYILESNNLSIISKEEILKLKKKQKADYLNFLHSEQIGILISTKPGQENLKRAMSLKKSVKNKQSYLFLSNNIDTSEFENFGINSWVNTACPRMDMNNSRIINMNKIRTNKS
jgi:diphthamide biosynthesis enzyme Dph1/Dph2-like protein